MSAPGTMAMATNTNTSLLSAVDPKSEPKTVKEQEYLSIKHALPKTRISHAILHENTSQDRHLNMKLSAISHRQNKLSNIFDQNKRNFIETQLRKNRKWKSQDEMGAATMNFPNLRSDSSRRPSMVVVYQSPQYYEKKEEAVKEAGVIDGKLLPYMNIRRERTEILQHHDVTYTTKLPTVIQVDPKKLVRYNTYCSSDVKEFKNATLDDRFARMLTSLAPTVRPGAFGFSLLEGENAGYCSDDGLERSYGRKGQRFRRSKPAVVFPTLSPPYVSSPEFSVASNEDQKRKENKNTEQDGGSDARFHSPTFKKSFGVKSGKSRP